MLPPLLFAFRETVVDYAMPLGLAHLMSAGNHYGSRPRCDNQLRPDYNPDYYHRASFF